MNVSIPFESAEDYRQDIARWTAELGLTNDREQLARLNRYIAAARLYLASLEGTGK